MRQGDKTEKEKEDHGDCLEYLVDEYNDEPFSDEVYVSQLIKRQSKMSKSFFCHVVKRNAREFI
jgi:hypothetical protein